MYKTPKYTPPISLLAQVYFSSSTLWLEIYKISPNHPKLHLGHGKLNSNDPFCNCARSQSMSLSYFGPATWNTSVDNVIYITIPLLQGGVQPQGGDAQHFPNDNILIFLERLHSSQQQSSLWSVLWQALEAVQYIYCQRFGSLWSILFGHSCHHRWIRLDRIHTSPNNHIFIHAGQCHRSNSVNEHQRDRRHDNIRISSGWDLKEKKLELKWTGSRVRKAKPCCSHFITSTFPKQSLLETLHARLAATFEMTRRN